MSDIVERLREHSISIANFEDAANEIDRLRGLNAQLLEALKRMMDQPTMSPLEMTPKQRKELWAAHAEARPAIAKAEGRS